MNNSIKKILDRLERIDHKEYSGGFEFADSGSFDEDCRCFEERKKLANYITNLQKENEKLKGNQVRALNKIKDYINASRCETLEGNYSNDEHSQYWILFNKQLKEIQKLIKGVNINQYVNIPKYREKELLNKEEQLEDYKSRNEKAVELIKKALIESDITGNGTLDLSNLLNTFQGGDE